MTNSQIPLPARRQGPCQGAVRPPAPGMPSGDPKEMEWHPYGNPEPWHGPLDGLTTSTFAFHNGLGAISSERHLDASGQPSTPISTGQPTRRCFSIGLSMAQENGVLAYCGFVLNFPVSRNFSRITALFLKKRRPIQCAQL